MSEFRGIKGKAALGGVIAGSPLVKGAVAQGQAAATFDGAAFNGVIRPGDTFTVAGDAQTYTIVTGGVVGATTANERSVTFTPNVQPGGGWADNAAVTFVSNSVAQVKAWEAVPSRPVIEKTTMGDIARRITLDVPMWRGTVRVTMDYGDTKQAAFVDAVLTNNDASALAVALVVASTASTGPKQFWGDIMPQNAKVTGQRGALFEIEFSFEGEGALTPNWN